MGYLKKDVFPKKKSPKQKYFKSLQNFKSLRFFETFFVTIYTSRLWVTEIDTKFQNKRKQTWHQVFWFNRNGVTGENRSNRLHIFRLTRENRSFLSGIHFPVLVQPATGCLSLLVNPRFVKNLGLVSTPVNSTTGILYLRTFQKIFPTGRKYLTQSLNLR